MKKSDSEQVTEHIAKLEPYLATIIEYLRKLILNAHPEVAERIKWNNPSFYYMGEMAPFNPKEYKREIIVMNLHKGKIMLIWPSGAKLNNQSGILEGNYSNGRRLLIFKDLADVQVKENVLQALVREWVGLVEKLNSFTQTTLHTSHNFQPFF